MRRRKRTNMDGSYDSLLDTLTNVIGILVIVATVTQLAVGDAIRPSETDISPEAQITPEARKAAEEVLAELEISLADLRERWGILNATLPQNEIDLKAVNTTLAALQEEVKNPTKFALQAEELEKELARIKDAIETARINEGKAQNEKDRINEVVENKVAEAQRPSQISLPEAKVSTDNELTEIQFFCMGGEIREFNVKELATLAGKARSDSVAAAVKKDGKFDDWTKFLRCTVDYMKGKDIGNSLFKVEVQLDSQLVQVKIDGQSQVLRGDLVFDFMPRAGAENVDDLASLKQPTSAFRRTLEKLGSEKHGIQFLVHDDSFETYLEARRIACEMDFAVGWIAFGKSEKHQISLYGGGKGRERVWDNK